MRGIGRSDAVDISFMGYDFGARDDFNGIFTFQINLPVSNRLIKVLCIFRTWRMMRDYIGQFCGCGITIRRLLVKDK